MMMFNHTTAQHYFQEYFHYVRYRTVKLTQLNYSGNTPYTQPLMNGNVSGPK